jgi:hypothetical protein
MKAPLILLAVLIISAPVFAQKPSKELTAAFDAVKRVPLVATPGDDYKTRRLDAEKALDVAKGEVKSDEDKRLYSLLNATIEARSLSRVDLDYGDLAIQCTREAFLAFSPADLAKDATEAAKKGTCAAEYRKATESIGHR